MFKSMPAEMLAKPLLIETRGETRRVLRYFRMVHPQMPRIGSNHYRIVHRDRVLYQARNLILWNTH